jgi:hypothetical protein
MGLRVGGADSAWQSEPSLTSGSDCEVTVQPATWLGRRPRGEAAGTLPRERRRAPRPDLP